MLAEAPAKTATSEAVYPFADVQSRLQAGVREASEEGVDLRSEWEPLLDSLRMVSVLVSLEDLFDFPLPPEKLVRRGGYTSEDDAVEHMSGQLRRLWDDQHKSGGRS
jgi:acyl carrier protein